MSDLPEVKEDVLEFPYEVVNVFSVAEVDGQSLNAGVWLKTRVALITN